MINERHFMSNTAPPPQLPIDIIMYTFYWLYFNLNVAVSYLTLIQNDFYFWYVLVRKDKVPNYY